MQIVLLVRLFSANSASGDLWGPSGTSGDHLGPKYTKIDQNIASYINPHIVSHINQQKNVSHIDPHTISHINHKRILEIPLFRNDSKTHFSEIGLAQLDIYERYT